MNLLSFSLLRCPVCRAAGTLSEDGRVFHCNGEKAHSYDVAKSGYLNLSRAQKSGGDGLEAVRARSAFLEKGFYRPLADRILAMLDQLGAKTVVDAGCGEGYYTNRMAREGRTVIGADLSKSAIDHAAKTAKREKKQAFFLVASLFDLPLADGCADAVINLFAPCAEAEFSRVLKVGGELIVVGAGENHLMELKRAIYETPRPNLGRADLPRVLREIGRETLTFSATIRGKENLEALFRMTPYYFRTSREDHEKLALLDQLSVTFSFDIFRYRKEAD